MDRLLTLRIFRRVAELQSFSAAARELRLSNAAVSKHVSHLEEELGARLLHRTTRKVSPTAIGEAYLERSARLLDELDELDRSVTRSTTEVRGTLRVNVPNAFGVLYISPMIPALLARWPELSVDMSMTDRFVDLVDEGVDVAIRIASALPDSTTLVARRLAGADQLTCATPRYLAEHGVPRAPADLAAHRCLTHGRTREPWVYARDGETFAVRPEPRLSADNSLALRDALLADAGIMSTPAFYVHEHVESGRLQVLLEGYASPPVWIHAVYPSRRHLSSKVQTFVEHVSEQISRAPWALGPDGRPARARV